MPCTTLLVGKKASYDGSTLMARNEDSGAGKFTAKKFIVVHPDEQLRHYRSVISKVEIDLPDNPMRYTAMPDAVPVQGSWAPIPACWTFPFPKTENSCPNGNEFLHSKAKFTKK